jgi:SAM-dependent methyltransferase
MFGSFSMESKWYEPSCAVRAYHFHWPLRLTLANSYAPRTCPGQGLLFHRQSPLAHRSTAGPRRLQSQYSKERLNSYLYPGSQASMSVASTWDRSASSYDETRAGSSFYQSGVLSALRLLGSDPAGIVLDCGCGTGLTTTPLLHRFGRVVACDFSRKSLEVLTSKPECRGVIAVQADVRRLPFRDGAFSRVLCANALQHLDPTGLPRASSELRRVSTDLLVVSVHHWSRGKRKAGWPKTERPSGKDWDYINRLEYHELATLFPDSRITSASVDGRIGSTLACLFPGLAARLGFGHMLVSVSRRPSASLAAQRPLL